MANTKSVGVAFEDPYLNGAVIENSTISGSTIGASSVVSTGSVTGTDVVTTTASGLQITFGNGQGFYALSTAITANSTTTSAAAGSLAITSNATGRGKLFTSDGTKWQFVAVA